MDYESGKAIPNNQIMSKIERAIGKCLLFCFVNPTPTPDLKFKTSEYLDVPEKVIGIQRLFWVKNLYSFAVKIGMHNVVDRPTAP